MIIEIHHVPGRLRAKIAGLKGNTRKAVALKDHFSCLPGVLEADARISTGSLVIYYASDTIHPDQLLRSLNALGHDIAVNTNTAEASHGGLVERIAETVAPMLVEAALSQLVGGPAATVFMAFTRRAT